MTLHLIWPKTLAQLLGHFNLASNQIFIRTPSMLSRDMPQIQETIALTMNLPPRDRNEEIKWVKLNEKLSEFHISGANVYFRPMSSWWTPLLKHWKKFQRILNVKVFKMPKNVNRKLFQFYPSPQSDIKIVCNVVDIWKLLHISRIEIKYSEFWVCTLKSILKPFIEICF